MIISIAGKKGSGKDTLGNYICKKYNFKRVAFGDPVKEICKILFGFTNEELYGSLKDVYNEKYKMKPREAFQKIGTDFGRNYFTTLFPHYQSENVWVDIFKRNYKNENIVITDVRFQNEVDAIKKEGGIVIYLHRTNETKDTHPSEELQITYDFEIFNHSSLDDLFSSFEKISSNFLSTKSGSLS